MCAGVVANAMPSDIVAMQVTELLSKIARQSVEQSAVPVARKRSRLEGVRIQPAEDKTAVLYVLSELLRGFVRVALSLRLLRSYSLHKICVFAPFVVGTGSGLPKTVGHGELQRVWCQNANLVCCGASRRS